jgi:hypothetical protein
MEFLFLGSGTEILGAPLPGTEPNLKIATRYSTKMFERGNNCKFEKSNCKKIGSLIEEQFVKISTNFEENG